MKIFPRIRMQLLPLSALLAVAGGALVVTGCKDEKPLGTSNVNAAKMPTMMTRDVQTLISDSGVTRYRITTPVWYVYDETDQPYWSFPEGVSLDKYDNFFRSQATVRADSATFLKNQQIWRLDGHVSITNVMKEKFITPQLYWDQRQHKLYSDSFIHIERPDKVLEGYGFDADEQLTRYEIRRVSGIFPAETFTHGGGTGSAPVAPAPASMPNP